MFERSSSIQRFPVNRGNIPLFARILPSVVLALAFFAGHLAAQPTAPTPDQLEWLRSRETNGLHAELVTPAPIPLSVAITSRAQARAFYNAIYPLSENIPSGWTGTLSGTPGTDATGTPGATSAAFQAAEQLRINWFRAMAGIPAAIGFDSGNNAADQQAALMMSANGMLSHSPPTNWQLYTSSGANAASMSNLALGTDGPDAMTGYIADPGSTNTEVGHRRWLLYPQTQTMGSGDVEPANPFEPANATWVFDSNINGSRPATRENFVAWPSPGYVPYQVVFPRWSFSYPNADFSSATVTMTSNGASVQTAVEAVQTGFGENTLVWEYNGLSGDSDIPAPKPTADTTYTVQINGVKNAPQSSYSYNVTVFDPAVAESGDAPPTVAGPATATVGTGTNYTVAGIPSFATGFEYRAITSLTPAATIFGAEGGLQEVVADTSAGYSPVDTSEAFSGTASYHLAQPDPSAQSLTLPGYYMASGGSPALQFESWLGVASADQIAHVQISLDDGNSWNDLFTEPGNNSGTPVETQFSPHTVSLSAYAGLVFQIRFAYTYDSSGFFFTGTSSGIGWNIDAISFTGVDSATPGAPSAFTSGTTLSFTPATAGSFGLQARAVMFGLYPIEWGPIENFTASASGQTGASPSFTTQPQGQTVNSGSTVVFTAVVSGAVSYQWDFNGSPIADGPNVSGAGGPQLMITDATSANDGSYTLVATDGSGSTTSNPAVLQVAASSNPGLATSISTRAFVGTGDNILIGGFYIVGSTSRTVLVQGLGPGLTALGVTGALAHPDLSIHQNQSGHDVTLYSNIGWSTNTGAAEQQVLLAAAASVFASPTLVAGAADSELLLTLPPGGYSAEVSGADGGTGVALCAIYELP
jgi:hypothetical protein